MNKNEQLERISQLKSEKKSRKQISIILNVSESTVKLRMRELNPKDEQTMTFAAKLALLAKEAPNGYARREVLNTVAFIRREIAVCNDEKKRRILQSFNFDTPQEITDIMNEFRLTRSDTEKFIDELVAEGYLRKIQKGGIKNRGRKQSYYYKLTSTDKNYPRKK